MWGVKQNMAYYWSYSKVEDVNSKKAFNQLADHICLHTIDFTNIYIPFTHLSVWLSIQPFFAHICATVAASINLVN